MKQFFKIPFLFLLCLLPLSPLFLLTNLMVFQVISVVYVIVLFFFFYFTDNFLLSAFKAKEVVESGNEFIFQSLKNESFKNSTPIPNLFTYKGYLPKVFIIRGRRNLSFMIEEKIFNHLNDKELTSLMRYLMSSEKEDNIVVLTLVYSLTVINVKFLKGIQKVLSIFSKSVKFQKMIFISGLFFIQPFLKFLFWFSQDEKIDVKNEDMNLRAALMKLYSLKVSETFSDQIMIINQILNYRYQNIEVSIVETYPSIYMKLNEYYV